jgi:hypothetical protein
VLNRPAKRCSLLAVMVALCAGCSVDQVRAVDGDLRLHPQLLELPAAGVGEAPSVGVLTVENAGRSARTITLRVSSPGPFSLRRPAVVEVAAGASVRVEVAFAPSASGTARAELRAESGIEARIAALVGEGRHSCVSLTPCVVSQRDPETGDCLQRQAPDGSACGNACLVGAACSAGSCVGSTVLCDDGDACTDDACDAATGCVFVPASCASEDPCQTGVCDPVRGCLTAPVADGVSCGRRGCDVQDVCVLGACVQRPPPEGAACGWESPCQPLGVCRGQVCERAAPSPLPPAWKLEFPHRLEHNAVVDEQGNLYLIATSASGVDWVSELVSISGAGTVRFRALLWSAAPADWGEHPEREEVLAVAGDRLLTLNRVSANRGELVARSLLDGSRTWISNINADVRAQALLRSGTTWRERLLPARVHHTRAGPLQVWADVRVEQEGTTSAGWSSGALLLELDDASGVVRAAKRVTDLPLPGMGGPGTDVFANLRYGPARLRADGSFVWRTFYSRGQFGAAGMNAIVFEPGIHGCYGGPVWVVDREDGSELGHPGVTIRNGAHTLLASGDAGWVVGWLHEQPEASSCFAATRKHHLVKFSLLTGERLWATPLWSDEAHEYFHGTAALTTRDSVMLVRIEKTAAEMAVLEIGSDGEFRYRCALEGYAPAGYWMKSTIAGDHLVVQDSRTPGKTVLLGYRIPGLKVSPTGWTTFGGNPGRTWRAR